MEAIKIFFKDKTIKEFKYRGRAGGSYTLSSIYENGWLKIVDEWGDIEAYPSDSIEKVEERNHRSW